MQAEFLNQRRWRARVEPANALFEYLGIFHNRRRHSSLGVRTPVEDDILHRSRQPVAS